MLRIGELARRTGTTPDLLRAWERRYGLLRPARTQGGFRLYGEDDARRVLAMKAQLAAGLSAAEAARAALADEDGAEGSQPLLDALLALDDDGAQAVLDRLLGRLSEEAVLAEWVLPALREIGERWERGEVTIAQEHFASNLLRGRLLALGRRWDQGRGPRVLLACPAGELHDLPLIVFGLVLRRRGWRILFLGADTPYEVIASTAVAEQPDLVVLASSQARPELDAAGLRRVAAAAPLALAGRWPQVDVPARRLEGDPIAAAVSVAA